MDEVLEMREVLAERQAKKHRGPKFWAAIMCLPVFGGLIGVASAFIFPAGSPNHQSPIVSAAVVAKPEPEQAKPVNVNAEPQIPPQEQMRIYETTVRQINKCKMAAGYERTDTAKRGYIARNKAALARLSKVAETSEARRARLEKTRKDRYSNEVQVAVGIMTGQLQKEIMGEIGDFSALDFSGPGTTKSKCMKMFAELSKGTYDIRYR